MPKRIQRRRTKGWRMPPNCVYVGRPSKHGNPYRIIENDWDWPEDRKWYVEAEDGTPVSPEYEERTDAIEMAVSLFRDCIEIAAQYNPPELEELRGKDLCCWCPLDRPCHADVLLELANREAA